MSSRERLIEAMGELLWDRGYGATTPRDVRELSGVGQGSMYHHFAGKKELAAAAIERNCADALGPTEEILHSPGDPLEVMKGYLGRPRDALKGCKVGRLTQDPAVVADPELLSPISASFERTHSALVDVIQRAIAAGDLPSSIDPDRLASTVSATFQGGYVLAIAAQDESPFDQACAGLIDLLTALQTTHHTKE